MDFIRGLVHSNHGKDNDKHSNNEEELITERVSHNNSRRSSHLQNIHNVLPDIKIHSEVSAELDYDHETAMRIPLGECSDEQLLAEVARRHLDLRDKITDAMVRETYDIGRTLGHGASGVVYLATHKFTNENFACKVVRKDSSMNDAQSMSTEIEIMKRIRHRHIVSMYELYETPKCLWIVLELVDGGDLHQYLANAVLYTEQNAAKHMKQIFMGIHYLHSLGVVHRDLKLENILLQSAGPNSDLKIADFGLSALVRLDEDGYDAEESGKRKKYKLLKDMWGTKEYFAPEVIEQAYGPQADVWALGCVLYEILCGEQAFPIREHDTEGKFYGRITRGEYDLHKPAFKHISNEAKDLLKRMMQIDPAKRSSASECLKHPWITGECHTAAHMVHLTDSHRMHYARIEARRRKKSTSPAVNDV